MSLIKDFFYLDSLDSRGYTMQMGFVLFCVPLISSFVSIRDVIRVLAAFPKVTAISIDIFSFARALLRSIISNTHHNFGLWTSFLLHYTSSFLRKVSLFLSVWSSVLIPSS